MKLKTLLAGGLCAALLLGTAGCGGSTPSSSQAPTGGEGSVAPNTSTGDTPTSEVSGPTQPTGQLNRLSGLYDLGVDEVTRPIAFMIGNNDRSRPQTGLEQADLFVEAETEGGITRIMAVFPNADHVPEQLAPLRSARTPFVLLAQSLDVVYCHAGGSAMGLSTIQSIGIDHINALNYDPNKTFWRDQTLLSQRGTEYSLSTSGANIDARLDAMGIRKTSDRAMPYGFSDTAPVGAAANNIQVSFSRLQTINFKYDAERKVYDKYNGALANGTAHTTMSGDQLSVANVLVMYDEKYMENSVTCSFRLTSGSGAAFIGGVNVPFTWQRTAGGLSFFAYDGSQLKVLPGKTYICLVDTAYQASTVVQ